PGRERAGSTMVVFIPNMCPDYARVPLHARARGRCETSDLGEDAPRYWFYDDERAELFSRRSPRGKRLPPVGHRRHVLAPAFRLRRIRDRRARQGLGAPGDVRYPAGGPAWLGLVAARAAQRSQTVGGCLSVAHVL